MWFLLLAVVHQDSMTFVKKNFLVLGQGPTDDIDNGVSVRENSFILI